MSTARKLVPVSEKKRSRGWDFAVSKQSSRRRSRVQPISDTSPKQGQLVDEIVDAKSTIKQAEAELNVASVALLDQFIMPDYKQRALNGGFTKSFNVPGLKTPGVQVTYQDRFSPHTATDFSHVEKVLKSALGKSVAVFFQKRIELKLKSPTEETFKVLQDILGDKLTQFFDILPSLAPVTPGFDQRQFQLPDEIRREYVHQYYPSIKLKGE